jgi:hypothetical protein
MASLLIFAKNSYNDCAVAQLLVSFPARMSGAHEESRGQRLGRQKTGFSARQPRARMTSKKSSKTRTVTMICSTQ